MKKHQQKFHNLTAIYQNLKLSKEIQKEDMTPILEAGIIKTYELAYEMLWKTIKAYLEYEGYSNIIKGSRDAFKGAYEVQIIENIDFWFDAIKRRNKTSHQYDSQLAYDMVDYIQNEFYTEYQKVYIALEHILEDIKHE